MSRSASTAIQDRLDRAFREAILAREEIVGCYVMTGEMDYLLQVLVRDLEAYGQFTMGVLLLKMPGVKDVKSSLALEVVKDSTALPLARAGERRAKGDSAEVIEPQRHRGDCVRFNTSRARRDLIALGGPYHIASKDLRSTAIRSLSVPLCLCGF